MSSHLNSNNNQNEVNMQNVRLTDLLSRINEEKN